MSATNQAQALATLLQGLPLRTGDQAPRVFARYECTDREVGTETDTDDWNDVKGHISSRLNSCANKQLYVEYTGDEGGVGRQAARERWSATTRQGERILLQGVPVDSNVLGQVLQGLIPGQRKCLDAYMAYNPTTLLMILVIIDSSEMTRSSLDGEVLVGIYMAMLTVSAEEGDGATSRSGTSSNVSISFSGSTSVGA